MLTPANEEVYLSDGDSGIFGKSLPSIPKSPWKKVKLYIYSILDNKA